MTRMHFSVTINAPREKAWNAMLSDDSYRKWTEVFGPGSHFRGNWETGSKILFLAPGEEGEMGMISRIRKNCPFEFISIEHVGMVRNGEEDTSSEEVKSWAGALEEYTFREINGVTEVLIDVDTVDEYREMFESMWPKALEKLKDLAEAA